MTDDMSGIKRACTAYNVAHILDRAHKEIHACLTENGPITKECLSRLDVILPYVSEFLTITGDIYTEEE